MLQARLPSARRSKTQSAKQQTQQDLLLLQSCELTSVESTNVCEDSLSSCNSWLTGNLSSQQVATRSSTSLLSSSRICSTLLEEAEEEEVMRASHKQTLQEIVCDIRSGVPSLQEEKQRVMTKVMRLRRSSGCGKSSLMQQPPSPPGTRRAKSSAPSSASSKRRHTKKWAVEETKKFFRTLQIFGTDFSLIARFFPNRNRMQIKNKFRKEEKESHFEIEHHLKQNALGRFARVQRKLTEMKEKHAICPNQELDTRVEQLLAKRNHRLLSFESIDGQDIQVAEEFADIFAQEKLGSGTAGLSLEDAIQQ